jgi:UDPglucose 6-dehydrogenase
MRISIFGSGYVGLVQAAVFADVGHSVICMDVDAERIARLRQGEVPFYEPGLGEKLKHGIQQGLLSFTNDPQVAVTASDYLFICVGTPSKADGSADLGYVMSVATSIATYMESRKVIVNKSTVPVGTADAVSQRIEEVLQTRQADIPYEVCSNPEFLKEGSAVADCMSPDRIIVGARSPETIDEFRQMYQAFNRNHEKLMFMDPRSAELTKYAANALLATKISFINEIANIAEAVGADIEHVRKGIGSDPRIGYQFIYPGAGYGGSCFPKDVRALKQLASTLGCHSDILRAVHDTNQRQKNKLPERVLARLGSDLTGKTIAVWGLSFKPNTDDMREAPSRQLIETIWSCGGKVQAYDPEAMAACEALYGPRDDMAYCQSKDAALDGADCLVICTEWKLFWSPDFSAIKQSLKQPVIIDGRNLYNPAQLAELGIEYYGIGRGLSVQSP